MAAILELSNWKLFGQKCQDNRKMLIARLIFKQSKPKFLSSSGVRYFLIYNMENNFLFLKHTFMLFYRDFLLRILRRNKLRVLRTGTFQGLQSVTEL